MDVLAAAASGTAEAVAEVAKSVAKGIAYTKETVADFLRRYEDFPEHGMPDRLAARKGIAAADMAGLPERHDTNTDLCDVSVFGPKVLQAGEDALIQVFLHQLDQREIAKALAEEADPDTARRGVQTLAAEIVLGQHVQVMFEGRGLGVDQEMHSLIWSIRRCIR